jgi:hypothetical protein
MEYQSVLCQYLVETTKMFKFPSAFSGMSAITASRVLRRINRSIGWSEFAELLTAYSQERYQRKEDAPLFSPTVFNGIRARENATITALIALDIEPLATNSEQLTFDEAKTFLQEQGLEGIVYTTASNIDGSRFRVVIPIAVPTDPQTHKRIITAVSKADKTRPPCSMVA